MLLYSSDVATEYPKRLNHSFHIKLLCQTHHFYSEEKTKLKCLYLFVKLIAIVYTWNVECLINVLFLNVVNHFRQLMI